MSVRRISATLSIVGIALSVLAVNLVATASVPFFWWKVEPVGASNGPDGLTWDIFSARSQVDLEFTFRSEDTDQQVVVPGAFLNALVITVRVGNAAVPVAVQWKEVHNNTPADMVQVPLGTSFSLMPDRYFTAIASVRRIDSADFSGDSIRFAVNVEGAVATLRLADGKTAWRGGFEREGEILVGFAAPKDAKQLRRYDLQQGWEALDRKDGSAALKHFAEVLRGDFADLDGHIGMGEAYRHLGRYREAANELEYVLSRTSEAATLHYSLAYAYVGLGDIQKAEATLRAMAGPEKVASLIQKIRDDIKARGK